MMIITGTYNPYLVALSLLVAAFASYTALDLGGRVADARGSVRRVWLVAAAIAMGGGIWSMHFVAMLAFVMPMAMSYETGLTALSLVVSIVVTGVSFYIISRQGTPLPPAALVSSGTFMGLGIASMHYIGMAAMREHVQLSYEPLFVTLSLVIAIGASTAALRLAFRTSDLGQKLGSAVVMGLAISGMHYTAMLGTIFAAHGPIHPAHVYTSLNQTNLALAVAGTTFIILVGGLIASVSEQRRAEQALREAQAELAHVNRITTMGELTASLAHELNQPMSAAVTHATACLRWLDADTPNLERARASARKTVESGAHAAQIIRRIRMCFEKSAAQREWVDVNELIRELLALLRGEVVRHAIVVRTELAGDLPKLMGDRVQLQQVLMNLIINSIDAMKGVQGTRELVIKSQREKDNTLTLCVSDSGVGLPLQHADEIFQAFFTTKAHGMGMGLSICRSIVEAHNGRLWAASNPPRGASFHVQLPFGDPAARAVNPSSLEQVT